jgi:hypothetical protein
MRKNFRGGQRYVFYHHATYAMKACIFLGAGLFGFVPKRVMKRI